MPLVKTNWIGDGAFGTTTNGRRGLQLYKALQIVRTKGKGPNARPVELIVAIGDFVHLRGPDKRQPYIARVTDLWEDPRTSQKMLTAMWCYQPSDLPQDSIANCTFQENEVILTNLLDDNEAGTILDLVRICFSHQSKPKPSTSTLFMDFADSHSWKDGPFAFQKYSRYFCSKRYVPRANRLMRLSEEDVETATGFIRGMSTKYVNQLLHKLAHMKAAQMEVQQEDDASEDGPSWMTTTKPETDESDGSMNAPHSNPPLALSPSLGSSKLSQKKRSFQGESDDEQHDIKRDRKELEQAAEVDPHHSSDRDDDLVNQFNDEQDVPLSGKAAFSQDEAKCRLMSCAIQ